MVSYNKKKGLCRVMGHPPIYIMMMRRCEHIEKQNIAKTTNSLDTNWKGWKGENQKHIGYMNFIK
jgi:hypothetical protein